MSCSRIPASTISSIHRKHCPCKTAPETTATPRAATSARTRTTTPSRRCRPSTRKSRPTTGRPSRRTRLPASLICRTISMVPASSTQAKKPFTTTRFHKNSTSPSPSLRTHPPRGHERSRETQMRRRTLAGRIVTTAYRRPMCRTRPLWKESGISARGLSRSKWTTLNSERSRRTST